MSVRVSIVDGPLPGSHLDEAEDRAAPEAGAIVCFEGRVRPLEDGRELDALRYEEYPPMTGRELRKLAGAMLAEHKLLAIGVWHSRGAVPVGACSFRLRIAARHRKEALAATDRFIDRMKRDVPLWKTPVWREAAGVP